MLIGEVGEANTPGCCSCWTFHLGGAISAAPFLKCIMVLSVPPAAEPMTEGVVGGGLRAFFNTYSPFPSHLFPPPAGAGMN